MDRDRKICPITRSKSINQNQLITVTVVKINLFMQNEMIPHGIVNTQKEMKDIENT